MRKLTDAEAKSGYTPDFGFNPNWKRQKAICGYEHCIELMSISEETTKKSCPIFGHDCPGGKEMVKKCVIGKTRFIPKERLAKKETLKGNPKMMRELKDIQQAIQRFCDTNKGNVVFISDSTVYNPKTGKIKDSILGLYGGKEVLVAALNHLRDIIKDAVDKDDFVNV